MWPCALIGEEEYGVGKGLASRLVREGSPPIKEQKCDRSSHLIDGEGIPREFYVSISYTLFSPSVTSLGDVGTLNTLLPKITLVSLAERRFRRGSEAVCGERGVPLSLVVKTPTPLLPHVTLLPILQCHMI